MSKIICSWMMCIHNSSRNFEVDGECKCNTPIILKVLKDNEDGLKCDNFKVDKELEKELDDKIKDTY